MKPQIIIQDYNERGYHNTNTETLDRLDKAKMYEDLSTVCIIPSLGLIHAKVVQNWMMMMSPMNQRFARIFAVGLEVGEAYNKTIEMILDHPSFKDYKYLLTMEDDNMPPPDGLLKLYESMDQYDVVGGLYWTKGEDGQPMIYGDVKSDPPSFSPQKPLVEQLQPARGLGMGFNLFKLDIFRDGRLERPWFKTLQEYIPGVGAKAFTQDLYFYEKAGKLGYKFACDTRIKVGHYDKTNDVIW